MEIWQYRQSHVVNCITLAILTLVFPVYPSDLYLMMQLQVVGLGHITALLIITARQAHMIVATTMRLLPRGSEVGMACCQEAKPITSTGNEVLFDSLCFHSEDHHLQNSNSHDHWAL